MTEDPYLENEFLICFRINKIKSFEIKVVLWHADLCLNASLYQRKQPKTQGVD